MSVVLRIQIVMPSTVSQFLLALAIGGLAIGCLINPDDARASPPPNDDFADAILLTGDGGFVSVSILEATCETNEPSCEEEGTAWYKWVAQASGELSVRTSSSVWIGFRGTDIYVGTSLDTLSTVVGGQSSWFGNAHGSAVEQTVEVQAGNTYYVQASATAGGYSPTPVVPDAEFSYTFTQPAVNLVAAVMPGARSVMVGTPATGYGALINTSSSELFPCLMAMPSGVPAVLQFRATDAENNFTAPLNEAVRVPAGEVQHFVFGITPSAPIDSHDIRLIVDCRDTAPAVSISGLNTFLLSASTDSAPDMVAIAATTTNDGIVNILGNTGTQVFAIAAINIGAPGILTATVDDNDRNLALHLALCQTDPATSVCINPPTPESFAVVTVETNSTATFAAFVTGTGHVPFDPANNRIFVTFEDDVGIVRGSTSVAVRTQ